MRTLLVLTAVLLVATACVAPAERPRLEEERQADGALEPSFSPVATPPTTPPPASTPAAGGSVDPPGTPDEPATTDETTDAEGPGTEISAPATSTPAPRTSDERAGGVAVLRDPAGDVTGLRPPDWADLRAGRLERDGDTFTLTHTLNAPAPREGDGTNTMNIATFFDIDGDGNIDYEIWANLSPEGWGTSYFDEREGTARYAADDEVDVALVDGAVELRFPSSHLADARSLRWSIASEYGPYQAIGTDAMARDYLPDDRSGRPFPD